MSYLKPRYHVVDAHHTVLKPTGIEADEHDSEDNVDVDEDSELISIVSSRSGASAFIVDCWSRE